jgi:hypothetical protein
MAGLLPTLNPKLNQFFFFKVDENEDIEISLNNFETMIFDMDKDKSNDRDIPYELISFLLKVCKFDD